MSAGLLALFCRIDVAEAQLTDLTQTPNAENAGIFKSLEQQIGAGVGNINTPGSSTYIIARDPARAVRRGRQLFQRKFTLVQGFGPRTQDGIGNIANRQGHRRRIDRKLRGMPWPAARLRRVRWRRGHATGQPRCAAPVRARPAGNAGRRDHHRPAQHPPERHRRGTLPPSIGHTHAVEQGHQLRFDPRVSQRHGGHQRRARRQPRPAGDGHSSRRATPPRSASSSWARSTTKWGCRRWTT